MGQGQGRYMGQGGRWGRGKPALSFPPDQSQALGAWTGPVVLTGPAAGRRLASGPIYVRETGQGGWCARLGWGRREGMGSSGPGIMPECGASRAGLVQV